MRAERGRGAQMRCMSMALVAVALACAVPGACAWMSSLVPMHAELCQPNATPRYGRHLLAHDVPYALGSGVDADAFARGELVATHPRVAAVPCVRFHAVGASAANASAATDAHAFSACEDDVGHALHGADALRRVLAARGVAESVEADVPVVMRMRRLGALRSHHSVTTLGFSSITDVLAQADREARVPQLWPLLQPTAPTHVRFRVVAFVLFPRYNASIIHTRAEASTTTTTTTTTTGSSSEAYVHTVELGERWWLEYNISLPQGMDEPLVPIADAVAVSNAVHGVITGRVDVDAFRAEHPTAQITACVAPEPRLHVDDRSTCALGNALRFDTLDTLAEHIHATRTRPLAAEDMTVLALRAHAPVQAGEGAGEGTYELRYAMNMCTAARLPPASLLLGLVQVSLVLVLLLAIASFLFCLATLGSVLTMSGVALPPWLRVSTYPVTFHFSILSVRLSALTDSHAHAD